MSNALTPEQQHSIVTAYSVPLPEPDCRLPMDGPPRYRADQMHAHAAAVSAAKDKEIAQLRAELIKSLADNAALRADAIDRQNNVVAPLRAEVAGLEQLVCDAAYTLEAARIWGGMEWAYNPLHPFKYRPMLDRLNVERTRINYERAALAARKGEA